MQLKVLGVTIDKKVSTMAACNRPSRAANVVWFKHHKQLFCTRIPLADRLQRLRAAAMAAFLYGAGAWTLSAEAWRAP